MKQIVDVVNFNCDASCLEASDWMSAIQGGKSSKIYQWLNLYVEFNKKISLGFTGASLAEIAESSPEVFDLINANQNVFEIIPRPFSHDISFLRNDNWFIINNLLGTYIAQEKFKNVAKAMLPPEFIITNGQLALLKEFTDFDVTFSNSKRLCGTFKNRYPDSIFRFKLHSQKHITGIPFDGSLTSAYLKTVQELNASLWNDSIKEGHNFLWRDGESFLLVPNGLEREKFWLSQEKNVERIHLKALLQETLPADTVDHPYPPHTFTPWMKELKYLGHIIEMREMEKDLPVDDLFISSLWLTVINSDILSSVEKESPRVSIKDFISGEPKLWKINRSDRWLEGDDFLFYLKKCIGGKSSADRESFLTEKKNDPHWARFVNRYNFLKKNKALLERVNEKIRCSNRL